MNTHLRIQTAFFLVLSGLLLAACTGLSGGGDSSGLGKEVKTEKGNYTDISVAELESMLQNKDFTFINVHVPYEGHIAQTDIFIPYDQIGQNMELLPTDKNASIVLYCRSGTMSTAAARTLVNQGFTHVFQLTGGFTDWKAAGFPLETQQPP